LGWSNGELSLTLINDRAMARLNKATFGRRGPTNVISFPLDAVSAFGELSLAQVHRGIASRAATAEPTPGPPPSLGEVVISLETTRRQAQESGWPWRELLDFYLIHGVLHLLGYDHEEPAAEATMNARAWELMSVLYPGRQWGHEF
jgi:probable rRNA maturation factor